MNTDFLKNVVLLNEVFFMQNYNKTNLKVVRPIFIFGLKIMPLLFWGFLLFAFDKSYLAILTILCALIHEIGHIAFAFISVKEVTLKAVGNGFRIKLKTQTSYITEMFICIGGPLINVIIFVFLIPLRNNDYISEFALINLLTALSNLLPIEGYDGYKILNCTLHLLEIPAGENVLSWTSFLSCVILCFISLFLIMKIDYGYWIYFVFLVVIFKKIKSTQRLIFYEKNGDFERF
jgi:Zn-dependent protease